MHIWWSDPYVRIIIAIGAVVIIGMCLWNIVQLTKLGWKMRDKEYCKNKKFM